MDGLHRGAQATQEDDFLNENNLKVDVIADMPAEVTCRCQIFTVRCCRVCLNNCSLPKQVLVPPPRLSLALNNAKVQGSFGRECAIAQRHAKLH